MRTSTLFVDIYPDVPSYPPLSLLGTQKYGQGAFDSNQKAVLTSCVLRFKPNLPTSVSGTPAPNSSHGAGASGKASAEPQPNAPREEGMISCCFSFTIRRDPYGIPTLIVGNFIKC